MQHSERLRFSRIILVLVVLTGIAGDRLGVLSAQTTAFPFQGRLFSGGTEANGTFDFQFTLWDAQSGGTQIPETPITQTKTGVTVTNGIFAVLLDFGSEIAFPGDDRYLEVQVRSSGSGSYTALSPRQALTSVPYAIYSAFSATADTATTAIAAVVATNASELGGLVANQYVLTTDPRLTGIIGPTGAAGPTGGPGATGNAGSTGNSGAAGATGPAGVSGSAGATGDAGAVGGTGPTGAAGEAGSAGATGTTGATGATGALGVTVVGAVGATGSAGTAGVVGPNGATGTTGAGITGPTGPTGVITGGFWSVFHSALATTASMSISSTAVSVNADDPTTITLLTEPCTLTLSGYGSRAGSIVQVKTATSPAGPFDTIGLLCFVQFNNTAMSCDPPVAVAANTFITISYISPGAAANVYTHAMCK